ncbi:hypothetical protein [Streptomyces sp. MAI_2237]
MSITPQMGHMEQQGRHGQAFPSTSPYEQQNFEQQNLGQQQGYGQQQPFAQQQPFGQQQSAGWPGAGMMPQLQQLGQQPPFHQLLEQLGQQQQQPFGQQQGQHMQQMQQQDQQARQQEQQTQQQLAQLAQSVVQQVQAQALASGVANGFVDIPQPLQGQPQQVYLRINGQFRVLNNPVPQLHQQIQEAFALGHQVIGVWDTQSPNILRSVRIQRI